MNEAQLLCDLDAAVTSVGHCFNAMRGAISDSEQAAALSGAVAVAHVRCWELQEAVDRLQQLMAHFMAQRGATGDATSRPVHDSCDDSMLLQLPEELLAKVAHAAGKGARLACSRLRDAYGCPGGHLRQLPWEFEVGRVEASENIHYQHSNDDQGRSHQQRLRGALLDSMLKTPVPNVDDLERYQQRWPGQVTSLELSTTLEADAAILANVWAVLPGLRELKCSLWLYEDAVPSFTAMTALSVLCSTPAAICNIDAGPDDNRVVSFLASLAPNLQSLELDLMYIALGQLPDSLRALSAQLTHLSIRFDERIQFDVVEQAQATAALEALAPSLRSLELRSPAPWLGVGLLPVLYSMQQLTRLVWPFQGATAIPGNVLPTWSGMGQLQDLTLGLQASMWDPPLWDNVVTPLTVAHSFEGGTELRLVSLTLPLLLYVEVDGAPLDAGLEEWLHALRVLLSTVHQRCPHLTSLQVGCQLEGHTSAFIGQMRRLHHEQPANQQWLQPVGSMRQLRHLVLNMDMAHMRQLGWLAPLPLLLSLTLYADGILSDAVQDEWQPMAVAAVQALRQLTRLRELTIHIEPDLPMLTDEALGALLGAAGGLPQLEVLSVSALPLPRRTSAQPWQVLVDSAPPRLRQLSLFAHQQAQRPHAQAGLDLHSRILQLLQAGMPPQVQVSSTCCVGT